MIKFNNYLLTTFFLLLMFFLDFVFIPKVYCLEPKRSENKCRLEFVPNVEFDIDNKYQYLISAHTKLFFHVYDMAKVKGSVDFGLITITSKDYKQLLAAAKDLNKKEVAIAVCVEKYPHNGTIVGIIDQGRAVYAKESLSQENIDLINKYSFENSAEGIEKKRQEQEARAKSFAFESNKKCCTNVNSVGEIQSILVDSLNIPSRSEFETTPEYNLRIKPIQDKVQAIENSNLLFKLNNKIGWAKYDADSKTMNFGIDQAEKDHNMVGAPRKCNGDPVNKEQLGFVVQLSELIHNSDYIGQNALGVKVQVDEVDQNSYYANILNFNNFEPVVRGGSIAVGQIKISPEDAKKLKGHYSIYLVIKPVRRIVFHNSVDELRFTLETCKYYEPTIQYPHDKKFKKTLINAELTMVLVVDTSSGNILRALDFKNDKQTLNYYTHEH